MAEAKGIDKLRVACIVTAEQVVENLKHNDVRVARVQVEALRMLLSSVLRQERKKA